MIRQAIRGLVVSVAVALLLGVALGQPAGTLDRVVVRDTKKDGATKTYEGTLVLDKAGLRVMGGEKADKLVATLEPADLLKFTPGEMPGVDRSAILALVTSEDKKTKKDYEAARLGYSDLLKKAAGAPDRSKRYLEYKIAQMTAKVADETPDDEGWAAQADAAVKAWDAFLAQYKTGWEAWMANRAYTRLLAELNKYDLAARAWAALAKTGELPPNLATEAALQEIDSQIRGKVGATAEVAARNLGKDAPPGATKDKLAIYESAAKAITGGDPLSGVKDIEDRIASTKDPGVRAVGHSMRGELYLAANKPREAMWEFLWVETVYNADKDEVLRAMARLADVFKALSDEDRARAYRDKIRRLRTTF
jgi:hypothetical protein